MKLPAGLSEQQFVEAVNKIINLVSSTFAFGYFGKEDIRQQCWVYVLKAMDKYDGVRPLDNFIYSHLRNRLINLWRDKFKRSDPPCKECHYAHTMGLPPHREGYCPYYQAWIKRNTDKKNLAAPLGLAKLIDVAGDLDPSRQMQVAELRAELELIIPSCLRSTYQRMLAGEKVQPNKRQEVVDLLREHFNA